MITLDKKNRIEQKCINIEERLDAFQASLQQYKKFIRRSDDVKKVETTEPHAPGSLFDGLLLDFIRDNKFEIPSGSEEETNYRIILENTPDPIIELDTTGRILSINPSFINSFEYRDSDLEGKTLFDIVPGNYHQGLQDTMQRACIDGLGTSGGTADDIIVFRAAPKEGPAKSLEGFFSAYKKDDGPVLVLLLRDMSYNRSLFEELQEARDHYNALSETISETIIRIDEEFTIIFVNSAVRKTFGYESDEVYGRHFSMFFPPGVFERNQDTFKKYFIVDDQHRKNLGLDVTIEVLGKSKHRGLFPVEMSFGNSKDYQGRTMTCILRDITQRKHTERRLRHLAYHDKLTGLGNRDLFAGDIRALIQTVEENPDMKAALMFLDLDGFKQVNDTLGHEAGDTLLIEAARRLRDSLRETDSVYRFGGDEFVVMLNSIKKRDNAGLIGGKILEAIREPFMIEQKDNSTTVTVGVSIGIALMPEDGNQPDIITKNADLAMYSAKESGKNTYVFYVKDMDRKAVERWEIEQGLKKGIAGREFVLNYQPLVEGRGKILGVEALVRWKHPLRGLLSPGIFVPTAEMTGLIVPMSNWILETACRKIHYLNTHGYPDLFVSVNVSPKQFDRSDFLDITCNIIRHTEINPKNLKLEITETCILNAPESAITKMLELKKRHPGLSIAIDDFGTGYSSLSYLSRLPADIIKIDLSFVTNLAQQSNRKIVNAIINLAKSLDLKVVAEGVETEKQLEYFISRDCTVLQGFYFSKPVDFESLRRLLSEENNGKQ